ncbi:MAG TPA: four helix bundle protein [Cytophagales bacterium]
MIQAENKVRKFDLEDRLVTYSIQIIEVVEMLPNTRAGNHLAGQLIRSGTSPALNYGEAQGAESKSDFVHKMKISLKELRETAVCLKIIHKKPLVTPQDRLVPVMQETNELISIFVKSIATAQTRK